MQTKLNPITKRTKSGDVENVYFDITILISNDNKATIVDNSQEDWRDYADCNTLKSYQLKINL